MWGAHLEAVELQILTLLEVRALGLDFERERDQPRRILDKYVRLLAEKFGSDSPRPLHELIDPADDARFAALARELSDALRVPAGDGDDDFFRYSHVGIELSFRPGQFLRAQTVTSYYEDFRRATRALARAGSGRTGRVERYVESGSDFALESIQITPLNGVPARARIALGAPYGQRDLIADDRVRSALKWMLDVGERADREGPEALTNFGADLDVESRTRTLVQTLRILPRGGVEEVKIGGTYVGHRPVGFRRVHAPKVMAAVAEGTAPGPYDVTARIRAIDLDRGSITHGRKKDERILCYLPPDHRLTRVGVDARIVGKRYQPRHGHPFVIAEEIELVSDLRRSARGTTAEIPR